MTAEASWWHLATLAGVSVLPSSVTHACMSMWSTFPSGVNGDTFWSRTGSSITTNVGNPRNSHGGADIIDLMLPSSVPARFDLGLTGEMEEVARRACTVASASPRGPDHWEWTPGSEVFHMIAGGTEFRLSIDLLTGVLLKVIRHVDGTVAEICEFTTIALDEPINDALFGPLA